MPATDFHETLTELDNDKYFLKYSIDDAAESCHGIYVALLGELARSFQE